jgi:hypothetical protein
MDEDVPMMLEAIADQVNFTASELENWLKDLEQCTTWEDLDAFQLPGMDFDPDAEPEGTTRVAGPVANLLSAEPSGSKVTQFSLDDLAVAAELALLEQLSVEEAGTKAPPCASA